MASEEKYVVVHSDHPDGWAAAWLLCRHLMTSAKETLTKYSGLGQSSVQVNSVDWNLDPSDLFNLEDWLGTNKTSTLYVLDCCPPRDWLLKAAELAVPVQLIDCHHKPNLSTFTIAGTMESMDRYEDHQSARLCTAEIICRHYDIPPPWWLKYIHVAALCDSPPSWSNLRDNAICRAISMRGLNRSSRGLHQLHTMTAAEQEQLYREGILLLEIDKSITVPAYCALRRIVLVDELAFVVSYLPPEFGRENPAEWDLLVQISQELLRRLSPCAASMIVTASDDIYWCLAPGVQPFVWPEAILRADRTRPHAARRVPSVCHIHIPGAYTLGVGKAWKRCLKAKI